MSDKELKMGDVVEVLVKTGFEAWVKRIFIKYGDNVIIVVSNLYEINYLKGSSFDTEKFNDGDWRRIKEDTYRPFTWEERDLLRSKWVKGKNIQDDLYEMIESQIHSFFSIEREGDDFEWIFLAKGFHISPKKLLEGFVFVDGSPCGVKEE